MIIPGQPYPKPLALLALDHLFDTITTVTLDTQEDVARSMFLFLQYARLMHGCISQPNFVETDLCRQVFAVRSESDNHAVIQRSTYLHKCYIGRKGITGSAANEDVRVELGLFDQVFCFHLRERLWCHVQAQLNLFSGMDGHRMRDDSALQLLEPCLSIGMSRDGRCSLDDCKRAHTIDIVWFNRRLSVYLNQIMVLDLAHRQCSAYEFKVRIKERR